MKSSSPLALYVLAGVRQITGDKTWRISEDSGAHVKVETDDGLSWVSVDQKLSGVIMDGHESDIVESIRALVTKDWRPPRKPRN